MAIENVGIFKSLSHSASDGQNLSKTLSALAQESNYAAEAFASLCGLSVRQLQRSFKENMAQSPKQWLNALRFEAARKFLKDGGTVKAAALSLGYKHPHHFSRDFRKFFGVSPSRACALQATSALKHTNNTLSIYQNVNPFANQ